MTADEIVQVLRGHRFRYSNERELKTGLADALTAGGVIVEREVRLSARDRIDLRVGRLGIEVKFVGSWRDVKRQLHRYLESPELDDVLLVTVKSNHRRIPQGEVGPEMTPTLRKRLLVHQITTSGL